MHAYTPSFCIYTFVCMPQIMRSAWTSLHVGSGFRSRSGATVGTMCYGTATTHLNYKLYSSLPCEKDSSVQGRVVDAKVAAHFLLPVFSAQPLSTLPAECPTQQSACQPACAHCPCLPAFPTDSFTYRSEKPRTLNLHQSAPKDLSPPTLQDNKTNKRTKADRAYEVHSRCKV